MTTTTAFERIADALDEHGCRTIRRPAQLQAQCPAHDDVQPSLSVRQGDGRAHVRCFAGCEDSAVLEALGLGIRDLFDTPRRSGERGGDDVAGLPDWLYADPEPDPVRDWAQRRFAERQAGRE